MFMEVMPSYFHVHLYIFSNLQAIHTHTHRHTKSSKPHTSRPIPLASMHPYRRVRVCVWIPRIPRCTASTRAPACVSRPWSAKFDSHLRIPNCRCRRNCFNRRWSDRSSGWGRSGEWLFVGGRGAVVWAGAFALFLGLEGCRGGWGREGEVGERVGEVAVSRVGISERILSHDCSGHQRRYEDHVPGDWKWDGGGSRK